MRYRNVDIDSISGLRNICLANNPNLGDDGLRLITEVLKEDAWVKCKCCTLSKTKHTLTNRSLLLCQASTWRTVD